MTLWGVLLRILLFGFPSLSLLSTTKDTPQVPNPARSQGLLQGAGSWHPVLNTVVRALWAFVRKIQAELGMDGAPGSKAAVQKPSASPSVCESSCGLVNACPSDSPAVKDSERLAPRRRMPFTPPVLEKGEMLCRLLTRLFQPLLRGAALLRYHTHTNTHTHIHTHRFIQKSSNAARKGIKLAVVCDSLHSLQHPVPGLISTGTTN